MSVERVIARFRLEAEQLRSIRGVTRDTDLEEYLNSVIAKAYDKVCDALEEDIRQSRRVHQDRT